MGQGKDLLQFALQRAVGLVGDHQTGHIIPPSPRDGTGRTGAIGERLEALLERKDGKVSAKQVKSGHTIVAHLLG